MKVRYLKFETPRREGPLAVSGVGIGEEMEPGLIDRPHGTGDRLLMFFAGPVRLRVSDRELQTEGPALRLWREGAGHFYGNPVERWSHSWLHFHGSGVPALLAEAGLAEEFCFEWNDIPLLESCLAPVYREITAMPEPDPRLLRNHLSSLFLEISRARKSGRRNRIPDSYLRVRRLIVSTPEQELDLAMLARMVSRSVPAFAANFRRYFGVSPIRCQLDSRIELARHLLHDRNLSVKEIGERCGYPDALQFSRMFRRRAGLSPTAYRQSASDA